MDIYQQLASIVAKEDKAKDELHAAQGEMRLALRENLDRLIDSGLVEVEVNRKALRMGYAQGKGAVAPNTFR